jgi:acyl-CoA thioester hydrolase
MYIKEFEIRWNDLDANRHLANSAYLNFMSHTRMSLLTEIGMGHKEFFEYDLGPVVFYEHIYYFREVLPGAPVRLSAQLSGLSEDGRFFGFEHNFYDTDGTHMAHCEMMGAWIGLESRKLTALPEALFNRFKSIERSPSFKVLTRADTRKHAKEPKNLV